jgi:hypothetical protein
MTKVTAFEFGAVDAIRAEGVALVAFDVTHAAAAPTERARLVRSESEPENAQQRGGKELFHGVRFFLERSGRTSPSILLMASARPDSFGKYTRAFWATRSIRIKLRQESKPERLQFGYISAFRQRVDSQLTYSEKALR